MAFLSPKKLKKLKENPTAFFVDAFNKKAFPIKNALKKLKPKKYQGFSKYAIVSAVYNVEKYLDDYFKSILNQRLDFKNNILIICVDDGSTDNSAKIIKKYQKKYPQNIFYLYKENGGQASARNLGLEFLKKIMENDGQGLNDSLQSSECIRKAGQGLENINTNLSSADDEQNHSGLLRYARNDEKESNEQKSEFKKFDDNQQNDDKNNNGLPRRHFVSPRNDGIDDKSHLIDNTDKFPENSPKFSNISWVTFTDPDDFLDRDYFYEVDRFLRKNSNSYQKNENFHQNDIKLYESDIRLICTHLLRYFKRGHKKDDISFMKELFRHTFLDTFDNIANATLFYANATLFYANAIRNLKFDEKCRPHFEDGKFFLSYMLHLDQKCKVGFIKESIYYYRQRINSTISTRKCSLDFFLTVPEVGWLYVLEKAFRKYSEVPLYVQSTILLDLFFRIRDTVDYPEETRILNKKQNDEYFMILKKCFSYIDAETIINFDPDKTSNIYFYQKGMLFCFKGENHSYEIVEIYHKEQQFNELILRYYTSNLNEDKEILVDRQRAEISFEKTIEHKILNHIFIYEKRLWVKLPKEFIELEIFIAQKRANIIIIKRKKQDKDGQLYGPYRKIKNETLDQFFPKAEE